MDFYPWVVFIHAASVLLFFIAHGVSMAVGMQVKNESDRERALALLDLSGKALMPAFVLVGIGLLAGIVAGFMGGWWDQLWIWISLALFLVVGLSMTPMAASPLNAIRSAAGRGRPGKSGEPPPPRDDGRMTQLLADWNPAPTAILGLLTFLVILWLMLVKPF